MINHLVSVTKEEFENLKTDNNIVISVQLKIDEFDLCNAIVFEDCANKSDKELIDEIEKRGMNLVQMFARAANGHKHRLKGNS